MAALLSLIVYAADSEPPLSWGCHLDPPYVLFLAINEPVCMSFILQWLKCSELPLYQVGSNASFSILPPALSFLVGVSRKNWETGERDRSNKSKAGVKMEAFVFVLVLYFVR